jgi:hypothetical protein
MMPFGRYRNVPLDQVPLSYLEWVLATCNITPSLRSEIERVLGERPVPPGPVRSDRPNVGELVGGVINIWYRRAACKCHPDRGGTQEQMIVVTEARDELHAAARQFTAGCSA